MSEIIERAARAAFLSAWVYGGQMRREGEFRWDEPDQQDAPWRLSWIANVRAAIAAMREPTKLMVMEGDYVARTAEATWHAMIDCALCEVAEEPQAHQRARQEQGGA